MLAHGLLWIQGGHRIHFRRFFWRSDTERDEPIKLQRLTEGRSERRHVRFRGVVLRLPRLGTTSHFKTIAHRISQVQ